MPDQDSVKVSGRENMNDSYFAAEEKRISRRIRTRFDFSYRIETGDLVSEEVHNSRTNDISSEGLQFTADFPVPLGSSIDFELKVPRIARPVKAKGRVVRVSELEKKGYYIGVSFTQIDNQDREVLSRQVEVIDIYKLLEMMIEKDASDLHLTVNRPPYLRVNKELMPIPTEGLQKEDMKRMIYSVMDERQIAEFEREKELSYALYLSGLGRWRVNVHLQQGNVEATYRAIRLKIKSRSQLGLPEVVDELARFPDGLVIIAGPTGVGKSTTMAAMLDLINREFKKVIVTLEDPIEFVHESRNCIVKQREVGIDTHSFGHALKHVLRQDPNVIFVGEVRDLETMSVALEAAETGHLVLTTLHTSDAAQTINRVLGIFPHDQRESAATQLASCLIGVVCQRLLPRKDNKSLVVATEVLTVTPAVKTVIRDDKIEQIPTMIQTGLAKKMHSMDASILRLYQENKISFETALDAAEDKRRFVALCSEKEAKLSPV
jgi:twitching motility protein PilT